MDADLLLVLLLLPTVGTALLLLLCRLERWLDGDAGSLVPHHEDALAPVRTLDVTALSEAVRAAGNAPAVAVAPEREPVTSG